ncbi:hypothetical protein [Halobacteriovorax sp. JY17]|uniref:hypothetical protein n=1 Tax=Halobacteriovorax sp. JY17 TaxID=2014617 RepID=UPI000C62F7AD|nr:hypothetical protein [Halobacteriovorax sp. JY17]PIK15017.1 MAG: hypothetical protein CES88_11835 [Halobacteriovorax sp. JY17]
MYKSLLFLVFIFSLNSGARIISPEQVIGFSDSSFNYNSQEEATQATFCFLGDFETTCEEIKNAAYRMNGAYYQGAHDKIELLKCELSFGDSHYQEDEVKVSYELTDDYGGYFSVTRAIKSCKRSRLL